MANKIVGCCCFCTTQCLSQCIYFNFIVPQWSANKNTEVTWIDDHDWRCWGKGMGSCILVCMQFKTKHIPVGGNKNMKTVLLLHRIITFEPLVLMATSTQRPLLCTPADTFFVVLKSPLQPLRFFLKCVCCKEL